MIPTLETQHGLSLTFLSFFGKAVLGLIQAFSFNWLYFEIGEYERTPRNPNSDSKSVS